MSVKVCLWLVNKTTPSSSQSPSMTGTRVRATRKLSLLLGCCSNLGTASTATSLNFFTLQKQFCGGNNEVNSRDSLCSERSPTKTATTTCHEVCSRLLQTRAASDQGGLRKVALAAAILPYIPCISKLLPILFNALGYFPADEKSRAEHQWYTVLCHVASIYPASYL